MLIPYTFAKNRNGILAIFIVLFIGSLHKAESKDPFKHEPGLKIISYEDPESFPLVHKGHAADIYINPGSAEVVRIAVDAFRKDIQTVTGTYPNLQNNVAKFEEHMVIVGTVGDKDLAEKLGKRGNLLVNHLKGKWETFIISVVDQPFKNVKNALIVLGSDRRGTAFGIFELSKAMGVSPWHWWADVKPNHRPGLYVMNGTEVIGPPSVQYRGFFLNDEDLGLRPWAAKKMDTDIKDIGPKTYEKVFELMLRLKANYLWPAMDQGTKAFHYYPENPKLAEQYGIVIGSSPSEPLNRNNVFEWKDNFEKEYGEKPGEWRYDKNKAQIYKYWDDRVKQSTSNESVFTMGMRGIHDEAMPGADSKEEKVKLLEKVIQDQRGLLEKNFKKPAHEIPQIFCLYNEVMDIYKSGMKLPDDITIVWSDDNYGYMRQLPDSLEQKRSGGNGVYYHFSYRGAPQDYLWLSSISPALMSFELNKAYAYGARKLWVFNVGDIKPAEMEIEFAMEMAWHIEDLIPVDADQYTYSWMERIFGSEFSRYIGIIKSEYYSLAQSAKPEHLQKVIFSEIEAQNRIKRYQAIDIEADKLALKIPKDLQDTYFQLVLYPVKGARLMNEKILYARKSVELAKKGNDSALIYSRMAEEAFEQIKSLTHTYNEEIAGGKWSGIMSCDDRNQEIFKMPQVANAEMINSGKKTVGTKDKPVSKRKKDKSNTKTSESTGIPVKREEYTLPTVLSVTEFYSISPTPQVYLLTIPGLGINNNGITMDPLRSPSFPDSSITKAPFLEYAFNVPEGKHSIVVKCLPNQPVQPGRGLRYAIAVGNETPKIVDISAKSEANKWEVNVLRGYSVGESTHSFTKSGQAIIKIYILDPGLVINKIEIM